MTKTARPRLVLALSVAALASAAVVPAHGAAASPTAHASRSCSLAGSYRSLGPTYVTSLSVRNTSCATGKRVVRAYYRCRIASGGRRGRCHHRVLGFRCSERRSSSPVQFDARVTCSSGSRRVTHVYTQNT